MRVIIVAPKGKMGRLITRVVMDDPRFTLVAGLAPAGREYIGQDTGMVAGAGREAKAPVTDDLEGVIASCDALIDFSTREVSLAVLEAASRHGKALVCGTTGFSAAEEAAFKTAAEHIPVMHAANTSRVVNVMNQLLALAAKAFAGKADIEIIEMHDRDKKDAPSGTSREMGAVMAEAMGKNIHDLACYGREGAVGREPGSIGYHSLRAGNIASSHTVLFGFQGERLEITHHSHDWECFARGACDAAWFLRDKPAGLYTIQEVFAL